MKELYYELLDLLDERANMDKRHETERKLWEDKINSLIEKLESSDEEFYGDDYSVESGGL